MRFRRWSWFLACVLFASLSLTPAQAALIPIDPGQPPVTTLTQNEAIKIATLQNYARTIPFSPLSPDDKSVLVLQVAGFSTLKGAGFLDTQSGAVTPLKSLLPFLTPPVWANNQTLVYISVSQRVPVLVALDRATGSLKATPVNLPGFPIAFSPNASRLLVVIQSNPVQSQASSDDELPEVLKSPFTTEIKRSFDESGSATNNFWDKPTWASVRSMQLAPATTTLAVLDTASGKLTSLFDLPPLSGLQSVEWSPDSSKLALVRNTIPNISTLGSPLSDLATQDGLGQLPPDKNPFFLGNVVDVVDFSAGPKISPALLKASGGNGDEFTAASWNSANYLNVIMNRPSRVAGRTYPIYLIPESGYLRFYDSNGQLINTFDNDVINTATLGFSIYPTSGDELIIEATKATNIYLYYYNRSSGEFRQLPTNPGTLNFVRVSSSQSRQVIFNYSSFTQAPELYRVNWDGTGLTALTSANAELTKNLAVRADPVSFTLANGETREGYLLQAASASFPAQNVPLIFWQEGGPTASYLNQWLSNVENPFELLANFGFAVLFVPLEGRFGFGPARLNALADNRNFGQIDIDHGAEIVQQAISRGYTSPGKIGITGCSYGGYYTSQSITRYPNLYNAAVTQCTLLDLFREFQFGQTAYISYLEGRASTTDPDEYVKDSPLFNSTKAKAPTLIFAGVNDFLPYEVSVNFHDQLQAQGLPTNMYIFNREGHGLGIYPQNQLLAAQAQISWFRQYLGIGTPIPASPPQPLQTTTFKP